MATILSYSNGGVDSTPTPSESITEPITCTNPSGGSFANVYKSAFYFSNEYASITAVLVSAESFRVSSEIGWNNDAYQQGNYYGIMMTGSGWSGYFGNPTSNFFPIFTDYTEFTNYVTTPTSPITSNGGGATHIAKRTGQLKDLSSYTSDILIVSGGGGGGLLVGDTIYNGADAGGISGSGSNSGNQSTGYAFGQGESGTNKSGGGSGLYGGYKGNA